MLRNSIEYGLERADLQRIVLVKAKNARRLLGGGKVALDGIADVAKKLFARISLSEDGLTQGAGAIAPIDIFFNKKGQFAHHNQV